MSAISTAACPDTNTPAQPTIDGAGVGMRNSAQISFAWSGVAIPYRADDTQPHRRRVRLNAWVRDRRSMSALAHQALTATVS